MLAVSTSLVVAWDRCGVSASCGDTIGLNKDDGPFLSRLLIFYELVFHGIQTYSKISIGTGYCILI